MRSLMILSAVAWVVLATLSPAQASQYPIIGSARVQEDGTLKVRGKKIRLHGIYIPVTGKTCRSFLRPIKCAPRAALALEFKIQGFVHCLPLTRYSDRSIGAICRVGRTHFKPGVDLGAYLLEQGWAVARPEAPFEYHVLSDIARRKNLGVWGFQAHRITSN